MLIQSTIMVLLVLVENSSGFWPPAYKIHLNQSETFVISDLFDSEDSDDFADDETEMIKSQISKKHSDKYFLIHQLAIRKNREAYMNNPKFIKSPKNIKKNKENPYEKFDYPAYAGFVDAEGNIINDNRNVYYANKMVKSVIETKINEKRSSDSKDDDDKDYDYARLHHEYEENLKLEEKSKKVLKYVDVKEEESVKESIKNIATFKEVKNCTKEEMKGIGLGAVRCFLQDFKKVKSEKNAKKLFVRMSKMVLIWFIVYAVIAVPLWCQKGWCCCCCRCRFCRPREIIDQTKQFLVDNPVGVLHTEDGQKVTYPPTVYEKYAQQRLEQAILKL